MIYYSGAGEIVWYRRNSNVFKVWLRFDVLNAAHADSFAFLASPGYS